MDGRAALLTGLAMRDDSGSDPMLTAHVVFVVLIGAVLVAALIFGDRSTRKAARSYGWV